MAWRPIASRALFATIVAGQLFFVVRAYSDPHKHFGYQPFSQSSTWQADIVRVTADGRRESIRDGWAGYRWHELVHERGLDNPFFMGHAASGIESTLVFFQDALDWVATHTPDDRETVYLEAEVTWFKNRRGPFHRTMRSVRRELR